MRKERSNKNRCIGLFSVVIIFVLFLVVVWAFNTTYFYILQRELLYWNYFSHVLMIALGVGGIALARGNFQSYGFTLKNWRSDLSIAIICLLSWVGYLLPFIFPVLATNGALNAVSIIVGFLLALVVVMKKRGPSKESGPSKTKIPSLALIPILSITTLSIGNNSGLIISTVIFQFFFVGFGEEILFRGYMQSRLNVGFGRPWKLGGVNFGYGLIITSLLFGILHMLNPFNPFEGKYVLDIWWGIETVVGGLLFGFVREKTGDVLSPSVAHGLIDLGQVVPLLL